jgi:hypothetical protein
MHEVGPVTVRRWIAAVAALAWFTGAAPPGFAAPDQARFEDFPAAAYAGPHAQPSFAGAQRRFRLYRTTIRDGFASGPLFAGHYVLFGVGCSADCVDGYVGDLTTGAIYAFPLAGRTHPDLDWQISPTSGLVQAHWNNVDGATATQCTHEDLVWTGHAFVQRPTWTTQGGCSPNP